MARIFDSHAHYDDATFDADREALLASFPARGVGAVIHAATDPDSAERGIALAARYPFVRVAVGIHPEAAGNVAADWLSHIEALAVHPSVCAIGEIGLDYHYDDGAPRQVQIDLLRRQLEIAARHDLPVILHDRDAHEDMLAVLAEYRPRGVLHCFSGSVEMMRQVTALGLYIGLGGVTTFKNARRPAAVAAAVPNDRLLLETDAPYMAPEPHRGERCDSSLIAHTAAHIASLRGVDTDTLLTQTWDNACTLFRLTEWK